MIVALLASLAAASPDAALAWTGAALGAGGLGVELWALAHDEPTWFAVGLSGEIVGLPLVAGSGLHRSLASGARGAALAPGISALGVWAAGCAVKAKWRTTGPESLGPVTLVMFSVAYGAGAAQWALPLSVGPGMVDGVPTLSIRWHPARSAG